MTGEYSQKKTERKAQKQSASKATWTQSNFVECNMSEKDKEKFRSNPPTTEQTYDWLDRMCRDGYKLSVSFSEKYDCYSAFLTATDEAPSNRGMCLSARAASMFLAQACLFFKHVVMLDGVWVNKVDRDFSPDRLG